MEIATVQPQATSSVGLGCFFKTTKSVLKCRESQRDKRVNVFNRQF